jgi:hypothetical protein
MTTVSSATASFCSLEVIWVFQFCQVGYILPFWRSLETVIAFEFELCDGS